MKQKRIGVSLALRVHLICLVLSLIAALFPTLLLSERISRQTEAQFRTRLDQVLTELQTGPAAQDLCDRADDLLRRLSEESETFTVSTFTGSIRAVPKYAVLAADGSGATVRIQGFDIGDLPTGACLLSVREGKLAISSIPVSNGPTFNKPDYLTCILTFRGISSRTGCFRAVGIGDSAATASPASALADPSVSRELLSGIADGAFGFETVRLLHTSVLTCRRLTDDTGNPCGYLVGAYGLNPFLLALPGSLRIFLLLFLVFQLAGLLIWLPVERSLGKRLRLLGEALEQAPLETSEYERDYRSPYAEVRSVLAGMQLRDRLQRLQAAAMKPRIGQGEHTQLRPALDQFERKLNPFLIDRGVRLARDPSADGELPLSELQLNTLLSAALLLIVPYLEQDTRILLRKRELEGFVLLEAEGTLKAHIKSDGLSALWEAADSFSSDAEKPGEFLQAVRRFPSAFSALRKTKNGIVLTLGFAVKQA